MAPRAYDSNILNILPPVPSPAQATISAIFDSTADLLTAHAGGGQAAALVLAAKWNNVTTVGTAGDSVALPAAKAGISIVVRNATGTSMNVFPVNGGTDHINALGNNAAFAQTTGSITFRCYTDGAWVTA